MAYKAGNHRHSWAYTPSEALVVPPHWLPSFVNKRVILKNERVIFKKAHLNSRNAFLSTTLVGL